MKEVYTHKKITWVDLENPTQEEAREIVDKYNIDPLVANELLSPTLRPRVDLHDNYIYLILHFPVARHYKKAKKEIQEIDFLIGKNFIITTRYNSIDSLHEFSKVFEVNSILDKSNISKHAGYIFYHMIRVLYKNMGEQISNIKSLLDETEEEIFMGNERQMVEELSIINRSILTFKESIVLHKEVLESFDSAGRQFFGKEFKHHLRSISGEYYKVQSAIDSAKEYLNELRDTNNALLSTKQNEIMKNLTVMAFVVLPLSLIAGIFGMNTEFAPIVGKENDFIIIVLLMFSIVSVTFLFFKFKKWIS